MSEVSTYHWHPNFHVGFFRNAFPFRFEFGRASDDDSGHIKPRGSRFYVGVLGFGLHYSQDGEYVITGVQTPLFHIGLTKIETVAL